MKKGQALKGPAPDYDWLCDYRLRRSRRALRFLLPIFRRRRGFDIPRLLSSVEKGVS